MTLHQGDVAMASGCCRLSSNLLASAAVLTVLFLASPVDAVPTYRPDTIVQTAVGDLTVDGYSVPDVADWNNDGLFDLIVGEGGNGIAEAKVRVYLNNGAVGSPAFDGFAYAQAEGGDLTLAASGCLGLFPRIVDWDEDQRKDLLIGMADGQVMIFLNVATDVAPSFAAGTLLEVVGSGSPLPIDVGARATPSAIDWDNDGAKDLLAGAYDGQVRWYRNTGTNSEPEFETVAFIQDQTGDLSIPNFRSSPLVGDFDDDGKKDLISGNTDGYLFFYANLGTDAVPMFGDHEYLTADGVAIDLDSSARSRPCVCDWNADGVLDLLVGAADGKLHLFQGENESSVNLPELAGAMLHPPFPNPFNPATTVVFTVRQAGRIDLAVYDLTGRRVRTLEHGFCEQGEYRARWSGRNQRGQSVASGAYIVRLRMASQVQSRKITLVQ